MSPSILYQDLWIPIRPWNWWSNLKSSKKPVSLVLNSIPYTFVIKKQYHHSFLDEIKVEIDRALFGAKIQTLLNDKNLYLPSTRDSKALFLKVDVPEESNEKQKIDLLNAENIEKHRTEIGKLDRNI